MDRYDTNVTSSSRNKRNNKDKVSASKNYFKVRSIWNNLSYKDFLKKSNYNCAMDLIMDVYNVIDNIEYLDEDKLQDYSSIDSMDMEEESNYGEKKPKLSQLPNRIKATPDLTLSIELNAEKIEKLVNSGAYSKRCIEEAIKLMPELKPLKRLYNENLARENTKSSNAPSAICLYGSNNMKKPICKNNVIPYYDREIKNGYTFTSLSKKYNEDVKKPPVFETFITTDKINPKYSLFDFGQHAYLGLRYTACEEDSDNKPKYVRRHFTIGFVGDADVDTSLLKCIFMPLESAVEAECKESTVATQTSIQITKVPYLLSNIVHYFNTYKYRLLSRNCNVFVKNMAKSIGLDNIAKLHSNISPAVTANKIVSSMTKDAKKGKFGQFYAGFDSFKPERTSKRKPIMFDSNSGLLLLPLNRNIFLSEVLSELCRDLGCLKKYQTLYFENSSLFAINYRDTIDSNYLKNKTVEDFQKDINLRPNDKRNYNKFRKLESRIINDAKTRYNKKQREVIISKINQIADQLDLIDILLRSNLDEYNDRVFKDTSKQISDMDRLKTKVELLMQSCTNKYKNVFIYLSRVRDMVVKAKETDFVSRQIMSNIEDNL